MASFFLSDLSPRSFFHPWSAVSHPSQRAIYLRHVSVTKCPLFSDRSPRSLYPYVFPMYYPMYSLCHCPLFSDLSPRSFPTRVSGFPTKITSPPSPILNEPAILFHPWSAVSHPSQRPIYLRHVSVTKCPLFSDRSPRSSWSAGR